MTTAKLYAVNEKNTENDNATVINRLGDNGRTVYVLIALSIRIQIL